MATLLLETRHYINVTCVEMIFPIVKTTKAFISLFDDNPQGTCWQNHDILEKGIHAIYQKINRIVSFSVGGIW